MLKLNKDKTESIVSISVKNLGLILDNTLGMEKQVNSICKSFYYGIRNTGLIHKYINDETYKTLVQSLIISRLDYGNALLYNPPPPLSLSLSYKPPTASTELCCTFGDTHSKRRIYNTRFVPAALTSCTFQITVQNTVSYIRCIEWNSTSVSKRSDRKIYTSKNAPI